MRSCDIGLSTVMISKKILDNNKFNNYKTKEDYSLWLKISKKQPIYGLNENLTKWRRTNKSLSSNLFQKLMDAYLIYNKQEKFNFLYSLYRTIVLSIFYLKKEKLKI